MRICHLISGDLWAGAEVQAYTMITSLSEVEDFELSAVVLNSGKLSEKLAEFGIDVSVVEESTNGFLSLRRKIQEIVTDRKVDILHTHRYKENVIGAMIRERAGVRALVQTVHGIGEPFSGLRKLRSRAYSILNHHYTAKYFDRVLAVSDDIRRILAEKLDPDKVITIHNSIDIENIKPAQSREEILSEFGIPADSVVIGSAGRMVPVKGFDVFIRACKIILDRQSDARFLLIGDGPELENLKSLACDLGIDDTVIFPGFRDDIHDLLNCLDVFVVSSYHEGIPMVVLEAMTLGRPIVSTAVGGILEIIENSRSGVLVDDVDPESIAGSCIELLKNDTLRSDIEKNAPLRIALKFGINAQREKLAAVYRGI